MRIYLDLVCSSLTVGPVSNPSQRCDIQLKTLHTHILTSKKDPTDFPDTVHEEIEIWKRWNSFVSGLVARGCQQWIFYGYYEIREALEVASHNEATSFDPATVFECKLWVGTQWLIRCGGILFQDTKKPPGSYTAKEATSIRPGPLCRDLPSFSIQRWDFWLSRLTELADRRSTTRLKDGTAHEVVLSDSSLSRVNQAIGAMHEWRSSCEAEC